uniref:Uncharacterized protein n=1 Tax=viral metagenome TaxID=1070528 RepID=A0A6C0C6T8_9ZZZZ
MSETLDLTTVTDEPVESNIQVEITDDPEEPVPDAEESVPDAEEEEEPVPDTEEPEPVPDAEEEEEEEEAVEEPEEDVSEELPEEPVEEPVEEDVSEEPVAPVEQVAADIRSILTEVPTITVETSEPIVTDNLCSLKTLVDVLGKWSGNEIRRRHVENLLKEGTEVDENLDDIEKVVEVLKLWIGEGGPTFKEHNHFKKLDEYTLSGESSNLSEEKKVEVLKTLTELTINVSHRRKNDEEIQNVMNNLY